MRTGTSHEILELGQFRPNMVPCDRSVRDKWATSSPAIKNWDGARRRHGVPIRKIPPTEALPGYQQPQQMVFCGMYPIDATDFENLREELQKLSLNDASFSYVPETSDALGFGFRCGFLGLCTWRWSSSGWRSRQNIDLIQTAPNVTYRDPEQRPARSMTIDNPQMVPDAGQIRGIPRADREDQLHRAVRRHRGYHEAVRGPPRHLQGAPNTWGPNGPNSSTNCRWRKSFSTCTTSSRA